MKSSSLLQYVCKENNLSGWRGYCTIPLAIVCSLFFLYTSFFGSFPNILQRSALIVMAFPMIFLMKPFHKNKVVANIVDICLIAGTLASIGYILYDFEGMGWRVGNPSQWDILFGIVLVVAVIDGTRRMIGWTLPVLSILFLLYGYFGQSMPGLLRHRGMNIGSIVSCLYMGEEGIFGTPTGTAANFILVFILFGSFLRATGAGDFFTELADGAFGYLRGGPAKAAVVSSGLMGMISGSAVANVVTTGTFTIPMMKKTGYRSEVAAGVEAVASTGGQIMPPIMGAAAFIMADYVGVSYWSVVVAAIFPAILYYVALFFMVDFEAGKAKLTGTPKELLPNVKECFQKNWFLLIPVLVLIFFLGVIGYSPQKSAFWGVASVILCSMFSKRTRITLKKFINGLVDGALGGLEVAAVCACAGIVIGILMRTGLGMMLSGMLVQLSGGHLLILLVLTMLVSMIMGMGMPTSACYIIVATFIAPAIIEMGVAKMAAHLFAFYYACLSAITPPVALASFAAAGVAKCNPMKVGIESVKLGAAGYIVPFMFIYGEGLLLSGGIVSIIQCIITALIGAYALSVSLVGHQFTSVQFVLRFGYFAAALLLISQGGLTDIAGIVLVVLLSSLNWRMSKRAAQSV